LKIKNNSGDNPTIFGRSAKALKLELCRIYSENDYRRFLKHDMSDEENQRFSEHLDLCPFCSHALTQIHTELKLINDKRIFDKTIALMDRLDQFNKIDIFIQIGKKIMDVIRTTGEILTIPQPIAVRGENRCSLSEDQKCIVQDFDTPPVSVQVCLAAKLDDQRMELTLSLYDKENEIFISNANCLFIVQSVEYDLATDTNGAVSLDLPLPGPYSIKIQKAGKPIADIDIHSLEAQETIR
jgi:hypothetical protein